MSSSCMPARYGYQSARAGSHRWTCASTTRSIVMLRSSRSHRARCRAGCRRPTDGSSGPPNEMDASGCGWLRSPIHSAVTTSSAPDIAPASSAPTRYATSSPTVDARDSASVSTPIANASVWMSVDEVRGTRELCRCLGAAPPARGRGVGHRDDAHRTIRGTRAWSLTARTHATSLRIASTIPACSSSTASQPAPAPLDPDPVRATTTASTPPASRAACAELLGSSDEVARGRSRADRHDLHAP